jgi:hypothetical protein
MTYNYNTGLGTSELENRLLANNGDEDEEDNSEEERDVTAEKDNSSRKQTNPKLSFTIFVIKSKCVLMIILINYCKNFTIDVDFTACIASRHILERMSCGQSPHSILTSRK